MVLFGFWFTFSKNAHGIKQVNRDTVYVCVYICVYEEERGRNRQTDREKEIEQVKERRDKEMVTISKACSHFSFVYFHIIDRYF